MKKGSFFIDVGISVLVYALLMIFVRFFWNDYHIFNVDNILINIILTVGLSLTIGYLGQLTLGNAGFMAIGAYTSAIISMNLNLPAVPLFIVSILSAGILSAIFGILIGIPALRLKGDYLAIITLGFGEIIKNILQNTKFLGASKGLKGIPKYSQNIQLNTYVNFSVIFFLAAVTIIIVKNLISSRHGRAILAIKEDEIAAEASGINITYYKIFTFAITAFLGGIAGAAYAHNISVLDPSKFNFNYSIEMVIMVVLGGMGSVVGSIFSAIFLTLLSLSLSGYVEYRMLIYAILLIITMLIKNYKPELFSFDFLKNFIARRFKTKGGR